MFEFLEKMWEWVQTPVGFATVVGGGFAAWQFWKNCRSDRLNNELTNAPRFYFTIPGGCEIYNNSECSGGVFYPDLTIGCGGERRVCWFGLANIGNFAARDVKIAIAREDELNNILDLPADRWKEMDYWNGNATNDIKQAEIAKITTPLGRFELTSRDQSIYVLLEYTSNYTRIRYKYLYQWCIEDNTILANISDEQFKDMGLSRPVFLREVRTVKSVSSNKIHWWTKVWTKLRCKVSRKVTKDDWLKYF